MRVSIVIDNYNYARFLRDAIDSALAQTWQDTEVVVVDDGSTDDSMSIIRSYGEQVRAVHKENGGQGSALTAGFEASRGDVVMFLDADDTIDAETVERVAVTCIGGDDIARVQWSLRVVDEQGGPTGRVAPNTAMMPTGDLSEHVLRYRTHVWPAQSGNAYRRSALQRLMPVPSEFALGADLYFAELTAMLGKVVSLTTPGGTYRVHGNNAWAVAELGPHHLHRKIEWTTASHRHLAKLCADLGVECPDDARAARDVAFVCQRLASLRLAANEHPIPDDTRLRLFARGVDAAVAHPHHTRLHKAKRLAWIAGVAIGPEPLARALIRRFYFRNSG